MYSVCLHPPLSVCLSVTPSLHSLTGLCLVRLSGHYMHHLFARCYCLHGGDFIRCCDNFINLGEIRFFPREGENGEAKGGDLKRRYIGKMGEEYITKELLSTIDTAEPFSSILMRYAQLRLPAVL